MRELNTNEVTQVSGGLTIGYNIYSTSYSFSGFGRQYRDHSAILWQAQRESFR